MLPAALCMHVHAKQVSRAGRPAIWGLGTAGEQHPGQRPSPCRPRARGWEERPHLSKMFAHVQAREGLDERG